MRRTRRTTLLATALAALPLAAVACGTATTSTPPGEHGPHGTSTTVDPPVDTWTPRSWDSSLLDRVAVPPGAEVSAHAPSKALEGLPAMPGLGDPPVVLKSFWTVQSPASDVVSWLRAHAPSGVRFNGAGSSGDTGGGGTSTQFIAYTSRSLPQNIAVGDLYLAVISTGPGSSAIGAYALSLAQPPRPAAENVPLDSRAVIGWSLAPGGTPARKELTGAAAERLIRDFNSLRVDTSPSSPCPLIPQQGGDIVVTFTADGHTWKVDVPACPDIRVQRDGSQLPALAFGPAFLNDLKAYVGHLPQAGPPSAGQVIPLAQPPVGH